MESRFHCAIGWRYFEILNIWQTTTSRLKFIADVDRQRGREEKEEGGREQRGEWKLEQLKDDWEINKSS